MLRDKKLFLFDIDGTIAFDSTLIDGTMDLLRYIEKIGGRYILITNNSTKSRRDYVDKFMKMGVNVDEDTFITSSYATAIFLREKYGDKKIFAVGTKSFISELRSFGINVTTSLDEDIVCAVTAFDNELTYDKITDICMLLTTRDIDYYATNKDLACPTSFGYVPDCGAICNMIAEGAKRYPEYIGKPSSIMVDMSIQLTGYSKEETLVVGDRLYTDIACGIAAGVDTAVVYTGEAKPEDIASTEYVPTYAFDNIRKLYEEIISE